MALHKYIINELNTAKLIFSQIHSFCTYRKNCTYCDRCFLTIPLEYCQMLLQLYLYKFI